jgi:hypothetical protein
LLDPWWFCGDGEMEGDDAIPIVGPLLGRWDQFHPALEWLVRELGLPFVRCKSKRLRGGPKEVTQSYRLAASEHFAPLPDGYCISSVWCRQFGVG